MKSSVLQLLIKKSMESAYQNVQDWMSSDPDIAGQLRDGLRTLLDAFDDIEEKEAGRAELLRQMSDKLEKVLKYYQKQPGDQGQWECSALGIVRKDIQQMISEAILPASSD